MYITDSFCHLDSAAVDAFQTKQTSSKFIVYAHERMVIIVLVEPIAMLW